MSANTYKHQPTPIRLTQQLRLILKVGGSLKKWGKQAKNSKQRVNILKEWISTERSYIEDLSIIESLIQKPLKENGLITGEEERTLFPNLKAMTDLSLDLTQCIETALADWNPHSVLIGEKIKAYSKFFMIYR